MSHSNESVLNGTKKLKSKNLICSEVSANSPGIREVSPKEEKEDYGRKDLQKKNLSLEWKSEGVMDDESGESMEPTEEVPLSLGVSEGSIERQWKNIGEQKHITRISGHYMNNEENHVRCYGRSTQGPIAIPSRACR